MVEDRRFRELVSRFLLFITAVSTLSGSPGFGILYDDVSVT